MKKTCFVRIMCAAMIAAAFILSVLSFGGCSKKAESRVVPVLMMHDMNDSGDTWSISEEDFRRIVGLLLKHGFTPVSVDDLVSFVEEDGTLPDNPVVLTFDDGYYSNYELLFPIVKELEIPVSVFVKCETIREDGNDTPTGAIKKMNLSEIGEMNSSPFVSVYSHTHSLHGMNTNYGPEERESALPLEGESEADYKAIFARDCERAEEALGRAGVTEFTAFSYPEGKSCEWAEEVLAERGYKVTFTTDYSRDNVVTKGDPSSLRLLGRMNINDDATEEVLLQYILRAKP